MYHIGSRSFTFFDRIEVKNRLDKKKLKIYRSAGAFTRKVARNSIKKRKKRNPDPEPNKPPRTSDTKNSRLRKGILFGLDDYTESVVVGVVRSGTKDNAWVFENGGVASIFANPGFDEKPAKSKRKASPKQKRAFKRLLKEGRITGRERFQKTERKRVLATFRPFPLMGPAKRVAEPKFVGLFAQIPM